MPWRKVGEDDYVSPSGRHWRLAQIRAYLAKRGKRRKAVSDHEPDLDDLNDIEPDTDEWFTGAEVEALLACVRDRTRAAVEDHAREQGRQETLSVLKALSGLNGATDAVLGFVRKAWAETPKVPYPTLPRPEHIPEPTGAGMPAAEAFAPLLAKAEPPDEPVEDAPEDDSPAFELTDYGASLGTTSPTDDELAAELLAHAVEYARDCKHNDTDCQAVLDAMAELAEDPDLLRRVLDGTVDKGFDPNEKRDEAGKWTAGGAGAVGHDRLLTKYAKQRPGPKQQAVLAELAYHHHEHNSPIAPLLAAVSLRADEKPHSWMSEIQTKRGKSLEISDPTGTVAYLTPVIGRGGTKAALEVWLKKAGARFHTATVPVVIHSKRDLDNLTGGFSDEVRASLGEFFQSLPEHTDHDFVPKQSRDEIDWRPTETIPEDYYAKAVQWREDLHPRDKSGRFISVDAIHRAKSDPKLAKELRKKVAPEDKEKLENALAGKSDIGHTAASKKRADAAARREKKTADIKEARAIRDRLFEQHRQGLPLHGDDLRALVPHLSTMSHEELSKVRTFLKDAGVGFGGVKRIAERRARVLAWAEGKATEGEKPAEQESVSREEAGSRLGIAPRTVSMLLQRGDLEAAGGGISAASVAALEKPGKIQEVIGRHSSAAYERIKEAVQGFQAIHEGARTAGSSPATSAVDAPAPAEAKPSEKPAEPAPAPESAAPAAEIPELDDYLDAEWAKMPKRERKKLDADAWNAKKTAEYHAKYPDLAPAGPERADTGRTPAATEIARPAAGVPDTHELAFPDSKGHRSKKDAEASAADVGPHASVARVGDRYHVVVPKPGTRAAVSAPASPGAPLSDRAFAQKVQAAADHPEASVFGGNKTFISDVYRRVSAEHPELSRAEFDRRLIAAQAANRLNLSRADLVQHMHPDDVNESQVKHPSGIGDFHFVQRSAGAAGGKPARGPLSPEEALAAHNAAARAYREKESARSPAAGDNPPKGKEGAGVTTSEPKTAGVESAKQLHAAQMDPGVTSKQLGQRAAALAAGMSDEDVTAALQHFGFRSIADSSARRRSDLKNHLQARRAAFERANDSGYYQPDWTLPSVRAEIAAGELTPEGGRARLADSLTQDVGRKHLPALATEHGVPEADKLASAFETGKPHLGSDKGKALLKRVAEATAEAMLSTAGAKTSEPKTAAEHISALAASAPTADARDHLESAAHNAGAKATDREAASQLADQYARAHESGKADTAAHLASHLDKFGASLHGPAEGEQTKFSNKYHEGPGGVGPGDSVRVVRQPVVHRDANGVEHVSGKGKVEAVKKEAPAPKLSARSFAGAADDAAPTEEEFAAASRGAKPAEAPKAEEKPAKEKQPKKQKPAAEPKPPTDAQGFHAPKDSVPLERRAWSGGPKPNTVGMAVHDMQGRRLDFITEPHDGTEAGIKQAAENLWGRAVNDYNDFSNAGSVTTATDADGWVTHTVSPNRRHVTPLDPKSPIATELDIHRPRLQGKDWVWDVHRGTPPAKGAKKRPLSPRELWLADLPGGEAPQTSEDEILGDTHFPESFYAKGRPPTT